MAARMRGAEHAAQYNLGEDVPYTPHTNSDVTQPVISSDGRGDVRPIGELNAPRVQAFAQKVRAEGRGGDYGPNSGGFDQLGYGTLTFGRSGAARARHARGLQANRVRAEVARGARPQEVGALL